MSMNPAILHNSVLYNYVYTDISIVKHVLQLGRPLSEVSANDGLCGVGRDVWISISVASESMISTRELFVSTAVSVVMVQ